MMSTALVVGSMAQVAHQSGKSMAETFVGADAVLIVDCSSSMEQRDALGGKQRYEVAVSELARIQSSNPGKFAVIAFATTAYFCPDGNLIRPIGTTNLADALRMARIADVAGMRFIVISDGEPNNENDALNEARKFVGRIDAVYVGPENDIDGGRAFLDKLVRANGRGGIRVVADRVKELAAQLEVLMIQAPERKV